MVACPFGRDQFSAPMRKVRESIMALIRERRCSAIRHVCVLAFAVAVVTCMARPAGAADVTVFLDESRLIKLPERVATVVIGNPLIADANIQAGGLMVITGKGYGTTNVIALDTAGAVLLEKTVAVEGPREDVVVVYRGADRETYSCSPNCEQRFTLGDSPKYFDMTATQISKRDGLARGQGAETAK
jgi:hypothetical protein